MDVEEVKSEQPEELVYNLDDVEIFEAGNWNGDSYTESDIDDIVASFESIGDRIKPYVKLGHDEKQALLQRQGYPAAGWITGLKRVGKKLMASISNVPEKIYTLIVNKAYGRISSEIYWNLKESGQTHRRVLKAVALLGADTPAVTTLDDFINLYTENEYEKLQLCTDRRETMENDKFYTDKITELESKNAELIQKLDEMTKRIESMEGEKGELLKAIESHEEEKKAVFSREVESYLDGQVKSGKITPVQKDILSAIASQPDIRKYSDKECSSFDLVREFVEKQGEVVPVGESASQVEVDNSEKNEGQVLHEKILEYMKSNQGVKYADAYSIVAREIGGK